MGRLYVTLLNGLFQLGLNTHLVFTSCFAGRWLFMSHQITDKQQGEEQNESSHKPSLFISHWWPSASIFPILTHDPFHPIFSYPIPRYPCPFNWWVKSCPSALLTPWGTDWTSVTSSQSGSLTTAGRVFHYRISILVLPGTWSERVFVWFSILCGSTAGLHLLLDSQAADLIDFLFIGCFDRQRWGRCYCVDRSWEVVMLC